MPGPRLRVSLDLATVVTALTLALLGVYTIASATLDDPTNEGLWRMQLVWLAIAVAAAATVVVVDYRVWAEIALLLHAGVIALLVIVLFVGREVAGTKSWLIFGPVRLQPSELAKWTTCLVLALYLARASAHGPLGLRQMGAMGLLAGIPVALISIQPDHGTALIFVPIYLVACLMGGVRWKVLVGIVLVALLLAPVAWLNLEKYQKERILNVLDPGRDPTGIGYQVRQSKIAIGSGGLTGKGWFGGTQSQLNFLPAQHTDFVLSVLAEEGGFLGGAAVLSLFYFLLYRGIAAARSAQDRLGTYICMLVVAWLTGQLTINVGMCLGQLPTIGVPLPLLSYGGSALVTAMCGVALIVNVRTRRFVN
jgi:rod shape determining protein RodA